MAIPSGSGTEVLKRTGIRNMVNSWTYVDFASALTTASATAASVASIHIITILSITAYELVSATNGIDVRVMINGSDDVDIVSSSIPNKGTFVYNDKIILHPTDQLRLKAQTANELAIYINFIDQDWN